MDVKIATGFTGLISHSGSSRAGRPLVTAVLGLLLSTCAGPQATVPDTIRGRVVSLYGMLWLGTPALGAFAMGVAADFLGFRIPVAGGACIVVATFAWSLTRRRRLRNSIDAVAKEAD